MTYTTLVPPELNNPKPGQILIVGRDPGETEVRQGRPFVGRAGQVLDECLRAAGIPRAKVNITNVVPYRPYHNEFSAHSNKNILMGVSELHALINKLKPSVIIALGNEASWATIPEWPSRDGSIKTAKDIQDMRGYLFEGLHGGKVIPSVHPALVDRIWIPWRNLLEMDLKRGKAQHELGPTNWNRPVRRVHHITRDSKANRSTIDALRGAGRVSFDIEIFGDGRLACIGFAPSCSDAYVCSGSGLALAFAFLERPGSTRLCAANGQFDIHYLSSRCGIRVQNYTDDTQLGWHSCYPELAGKADNKSYQATRKSLGFLASLFTWDEYWKDYNFKHETERWNLNGLDCMITHEVMNNLDPLIDDLGVRGIYNHAIDLVWPVVDMQQRGLRVDLKKFNHNIDLIKDRQAELEDEIQEFAKDVVEPVLDQISRPHLFQDVWTCPCCRNGAGKRDRCWSCAGFSEKPNKKALMVRFPKAKGTIAEITDKYLEPCKLCDGLGQKVNFVFKPGSPDQLRIILYDILKFRKRTSKGKLTTDENALKDMLSELEDA